MAEHILYFVVVSHGSAKTAPDIEKCFVRKINSKLAGNSGLFLCVFYLFIYLFIYFCNINILSSDDQNKENHRHLGDIALSCTTISDWRYFA